MPHPRDENKPNNTVSNILRTREDRDDVNKIIKEQEKEYRKALNSIADTEYGKFVFQILIKTAGVFDPIDPKDLLRANDRNMYLKFIRPFLEPELRKELEK